MAHTHSVYDTDSHFSVDPITRQMTNMSSQKTTLIQGDHNSERFTFEIPRYIEEHDMALCNKVQVHYINIDNTSREKSADVYECTDFQISPDSDEVMICSWLISCNATKYVGSLNFCLRLACMTGSEVEYVWVTAVNSGITVAEGIDNAPAVIQQYSDVLEQWYLELIAAENRGVNAIHEAETIAIGQIELKKDEILGDVDRALDSILAIQAELMGLKIIKFADDLNIVNKAFSIQLDGETIWNNSDCVGNAFVAKSVEFRGMDTLWFYGVTASGEEIKFQLELVDAFDARYTLELTESVTITRVSVADVPVDPDEPKTITFEEGLDSEDDLNFKVYFDGDPIPHYRYDVEGVTFTASTVTIKPTDSYTHLECEGYTASGYWYLDVPEEGVTFELTESVTVQIVREYEGDL